MTVIAWDGHTLAADRNCEAHYVRLQRKKLRSLPDGAVAGGAGDTDRILELMRWLEQGADEKKFPEHARCNCTVLVVPTVGDVRMYCGGAVPAEFPRDRPVAIGSGSEVATTAMRCGKDAAEAVRLACEISTGCAGGPDVMEPGWIPAEPADALP